MPWRITTDDILNGIAGTGKSVELYLEEYIKLWPSDNDSLHAIVRYVLPDIGLRLRPFLLRTSYEAGGNSFDDILPIAAAIELIQISTLVLDDILDDSSLRNGQLSVYGKWGAKSALSTGMILSSSGFSLLSKELAHCQNCSNKIDVLKLISCAHQDIYFGQFADFDYEGQTAVTEEQYIEMITKTTASFIQAPLVAGAMLWNASQSLTTTLKYVGRNLGIAYQMRDDVIDIIGDPELTGKPRAGDIRERKMRLPIIHALANSDERDRTKILRALQTDSKLSEAEIERIIEILSKTGSIEYVIEKTRGFCRDAVNQLRSVASEFATLVSQLSQIANLIASFDVNGTR